MQPDMISLMQQLVTAVQSIALSVDVMSMDLRALNKNVSQLVRKEIHRAMSPLTLAAECSYSQDGEAGSQVLPGPNTDQIPGVDGATPCPSPDFQDDDDDDDDESQEKFPTIRDSLREDIKKAMNRSGGLDNEPLTSREVGEGSGWETCGQILLSDNTNTTHQNMTETLKGSDLRSGPGQHIQSGGSHLQSGGPTHMSASGQHGQHPVPASNIPLRGRPPKNPSDGLQKNNNGLFSCVWCGREFSDNYKLKRHWRVHTGEKPFPCFQCGKAFAHKEYLIIHQRLHSGERPFRCDVCGKAFITKDRLTVHRRVHSGEKPFNCELCGKCFARKEKLTSHRRVHSGEKPFACELCGKAFGHQSNLIIHRRVHTGERPFPCEICGKAFRQKDNLVVHRRVHTGERPFPCEECGKAFKDSGKLNRHKRVHMERHSQ